MKKIVRISFWAALILCLPELVHAQSGCVNSPENPTAILALFGVAGGSFPWLRSKLLGRRKR
jgi:XrtJ-associated TM-motif-TM protein